MVELNNGITFNGVHIVIIIFIINLIINNGSLFEYIRKYLMVVETLNLWLFFIHMFILYLILSNITFEFGFRAAIKFKY